MAGGEGPRVLVLQHADWEVTGAYGTLLDERGAAVTVVRPDLGQPIPGAWAFDAVVAMGGPMSVNDADRLPWLRAEIMFAGTAVDAGLPFFGTCLGAQVLARSFGGTVAPGPRPEFGLHPVTMTDFAGPDPVLGEMPTDATVFQWHGEGFSLPPGAVPLASSAGYPCQAIRIGEAAYGVQFHLEVTVGLLADWLAVPSCRDEVVRHLGPDGPERLLRDFQERGPAVVERGRRMFSAWLDLVDRRRLSAHRAAVRTV